MPGERGVCRARGSEGGTLVSYNYGAVTAAALDPIEKKPLYHFRPGSLVYSLGTFGCNLACDFCQNHAISQAEAPPYRSLSPDDAVRAARASGATGIAFTYSEPVVWIEYVLDVASRYDGDRILVSNGYLNARPLSDLAAVIDAANIDIKGGEAFYGRRCHAPYHDALKTVRRLFERGVHVEATTLVIPGENDADADLSPLFSGLCAISPDIPLHLSRFYPHFRMLDVPSTPEETLHRARELAHEGAFATCTLETFPPTRTRTAPSAARRS
jgi:pyruvate formate lyase activating enzyme